MNLVINLEERCGVGQIVGGVFGFYHNNPVTCRLELGRNNIFDVFGCDRKGNKGGRNIDIFKRSAHGVLAADCGDFEIHLSLECAEQSRKRLAPTLRILHGLLKIFLECQINILKLCACGNKL